MLVDRTASSSRCGSTRSPTAAKEQALYDEFATTICPSGRFVAHILVKDAGRRRRAACRSCRPAQRSPTLAKAKSTDTARRKQGGALGCLTRERVRQGSSRTRPRRRAARHADRSGEDAVRLPPDPGAHAGIRVDVTSRVRGGAAAGRELGRRPAPRRSIHVWVNPRYGTWRGSASTRRPAASSFARAAPPVAGQRGPAGRSRRRARGDHDDDHRPTVPAGG